MKRHRTLDAEPVGPGGSGGEEDVLDLGQAHWLGRGWKRECFLHPNDPGLCIKVPRVDSHERSSLYKRVLNWRQGASSGEQHNRREFIAYQRFGALLAPFVPRYHRFIKTSRGPGLVIDAVRDRDGGSSVQLRDWLRQGTEDRGAALLTQFRVLFDLLEEQDLWLMDLNLQNFLVQVLPDGTERPWLIDLKRLADNKEIFQVSGWSTILKRRKLARRIDRFNAKFKARLGH